MTSFIFPEGVFCVHNDVKGCVSILVCVDSCDSVCFTSHVFTVMYYRVLHLFHLSCVTMVT